MAGIRNRIGGQNGRGVGLPVSGARQRQPHSAPLRGLSGRLWEPTSEEAFEHVAPVGCAFFQESGGGGEDGVDERGGVGSGQFPFGEGPELERFHPADQRVGHTAKTSHKSCGYVPLQLPNRPKMDAASSTAARRRPPTARAPVSWRLPWPRAGGPELWPAIRPVTRLADLHATGKSTG